MSNTVRLVFSLFMVAVYIGMAYLLIFTELFHFNEILRIVMGCIFAAYGIYRGFRLWRGWGRR